MVNRDRLQGGVVLPITLIFLVVMMVLGIAGIRNVMLEEKMTGNLRSQQLAFQAAEQALRFCEKKVEQGDPGVIVNPAGPIQTGASKGKNYWEVADSWHNSKISMSVPVTMAGIADPLAARPECMVEELDLLFNPSNPRDQRRQFRITARGVGTISTAAVYLQSYFILSPES